MGIRSQKAIPHAACTAHDSAHRLKRRAGCVGCAYKMLHIHSSLSSRYGELENGKRDFTPK